MQLKPITLTLALAAITLAQKQTIAATTGPYAPGASSVSAEASSVDLSIASSITSALERNIIDHVLCLDCLVECQLGGKIGAEERGELGL
jgi:hypothetical protein